MEIKQGQRPRLQSQGLLQRKVLESKVSFDNVNIPFQAGSLTKKLQNWQLLTEDEWILNAIKGYKIEFFKTPVQFSTPKVIDFGQDRNDIVDQEVSELLRLGAISQCEHEQGEFISNIFLVTKKGG